MDTCALGFPANPQTSVPDDAVKAAYELGVMMVVLAGNTKQETMLRLPARTRHALTAAATD